MIRGDWKRQAELEEMRAKTHRKIAAILPQPYREAVNGLAENHEELAAMCHQWAKEDAGKRTT